MKLSIIIPVYNAMHTIQRCVDSIEKAKYKDYEIILIEDGSKDNSLSVCRKLSEKYNNIKLLCNGKNRGVSFTRNRGIETAQGKYMMFVDSDDWVSEDYVDCFAKILNKAEYKLLVCGYMNHDEKQSGKTEKFVWKEDSDDNVYNVKAIIAELYEERLLQQLWNKAFFAEIIRREKIRFDETINIGEDFRFILDYIKYGDIEQIYFIKRPLYHYMRDQKGSLMYHIGYEGIEEPLKNLKQMYIIMGKQGEEIQKFLRIQRQHQIELYAYLIIHNYGMHLREKRQLILQLDSEQGRILFRRNLILYCKERIKKFLDEFLDSRN